MSVPPPAGNPTMIRTSLSTVCARAPNGHAAAAPTSVMNSRLRMDDLDRRIISCGEQPYLAPHLVGKLHHHAQLRPLLLLGEHVAFLGGGKAALRRQAELIEACVFGRLLDAALDVALVFQLAGFGGDKA